MGSRRRNAENGTCDGNRILGDSYDITTDTDGEIVEATAVPEPGTAALVASGLVVIGVARRRSR